MKVIKTKDDIIRDIAKQTGDTLVNTRKFYDALESVVFESLSSAKEDKEVCLKLFEGVKLIGEFSPEKTKKNNLTGETIIVENRIIPRAEFTRRYGEKLNNK